MQLGLSLSLTRAGVSIWTPRRLFAAGEQGAWYDASDLSTLFQDSAGTTPVTAVGQPVGLMKDKSGRGNHASQSTTTARPTLQKDSGGRYYLSFDGVDDMLSTGAIDLSGTHKASSSIGLRKESDASAGIVIEFGTNSNSVIGTFDIEAPSGALNNYAARQMGATTSRVAQVGTFTSPHLGVLTCAYDLAAPQVSVSVNGAASTVNTASVGDSVMASTSLFIGARSGGSFPFKGRVYGMIVLGRAMTTAEVSSVNRYLAARSGVTL